jgi:hypothetical protein
MGYTVIKAFVGGLGPPITFSLVVEQTLPRTVFSGVDMRRTPLLNHEHPRFYDKTRIGPKKRCAGNAAPIVASFLEYLQIIQLALRSVGCCNKS